MSGRAAILVVNGGRDPQEGRWLQLCIDEIEEHTTWPDYRIYVWNNNTHDPWVAEFLRDRPRVTLLSGDPAQTPAHPHAVPLQRLYERARLDGAQYVVTMDSDAHPIRAGWLTELISVLDSRTVLSGVWRDELQTAIAPYVHPSCLCTTVDFIESSGLRFDRIVADGATRHDTLSHFTEGAAAHGLRVWPLRRSNRNQLHRVIGGVYGDLIYHHAAGSRGRILFCDERRSQRQKRENRQVHQLATALLFHHHEPYLAWLRGEILLPLSGPGLRNTPFVFILGMHRSGTSCLAGALERCGLFLGNVSRANTHNAKGNYEVAEIVRLHDAILAANGGSWSQPPPSVAVNREHQAAIEQIAAASSPSTSRGLKDPRLVFLLEPWMNAVGGCVMVGTFRHPAAVAASLARRNQIAVAEAYALWLRYNHALVRLHQRYRLPLVEFELSDAAAYCDTVAALAITLGLRPCLKQLREFVSAELDHHRAGRAPVPDSCQETYAYLAEHRYRPSASVDSFESLMMEFARGELHERRRLTLRDGLRRLWRRPARSSLC